MPSPGPSAAILVAALCAALSACTPAPTASPTPTPLYSYDAEALAAAEQTYRDYIDAYNKIDLADPATFEPVYALSTGDNIVYLKRELTRLHADGWTVSGDRVIDLIQPLGEATNTTSLRFEACLNGSNVDLKDANGTSQIPPDRPAALPIYVDVARPDLLNSWKVEDERGRDGGQSCGR